MFTGFCINGTRYHVRDYLASLLLFAGLVALYNANISANIVFEPMGIILMSAALIADSIGSNLQEKILQEFNATPNELVCANSVH